MTGQKTNLLAKLIHYEFKIPTPVANIIHLYTPCMIQMTCCINFYYLVFIFASKISYITFKNKI